MRLMEWKIKLNKKNKQKENIKENIKEYINKSTKLSNFNLLERKT